MKCTECGREFVATSEEEDICSECQWENAPPELRGDEDPGNYFDEDDWRYDDDPDEHDAIWGNSGQSSD